jgi:hypothetical protein
MIIQTKTNIINMNEVQVIKIIGDFCYIYCKNRRKPVVVKDEELLKVFESYSLGTVGL